MNTNYILSGKYRLLRCLGEGTTGNVYLARHSSLESEYAIKVFPKKTSASLYALSEARILQSLHHPAIPIVHDLEEDENYIYLIEEYIVGESLENHLLHQKSFSPEMLIEYFRQLCDVFIYLHNCKPTPVIYMDIKPDHIIVCGNQLKIIDFGSSFQNNNSEKDFLRYGNKEFSAPETVNTTDVSERMTVYSLGKILALMAGYVDSPISHNISSITRKAYSKDPALRYETVEALWFDFNNKVKKDKRPHLVKNIALVGSCAGCGTTHIAISLTSLLNYFGHNTFYMEKNGTNQLLQMAQNIPRMVEHSQGYYVYKHFQGFPEYGPGILITTPREACIVSDYGINCLHEELAFADVILLICNDAFLSRKDAIEQAKILQSYSAPIYLINNPGCREQSLFLAKHCSLPVYSYIKNDDPFRIDQKKKLWFQQLFPKKGRDKKFLHVLKNPHRR